MRVVKHCNELPREVVESLNFGNTQNSTEIQNSKYTRDSITLSANPNTVKDGLRRPPTFRLLSKEFSGASSEKLMAPLFG